MPHKSQHTQPPRKGFAAADLATSPSPVYPRPCPHSPVLHDAAHIVDSTMAQVSAQEVTHQLGNKMYQLDWQIQE